MVVFLDMIYMCSIYGRATLAMEKTCVIHMLIAHFIYKEEVYIEGIKIGFNCKYGWHILAVAVLWATYGTAAYSTV